MGDNGKLTRAQAAKIEKERDLTFGEYIDLYYPHLEDGMKITARALAELKGEYRQYRRARTKKFMAAAMSGVYDELERKSKDLAKAKTPRGQLELTNEWLKMFNEAIKVERAMRREEYLGDYDNLTPEEKAALLPTGTRDPANPAVMGKNMGDFEKALTPVKVRMLANLTNLVPEFGGPLLSQVGGQQVGGGSPLTGGHYEALSGNYRAGASAFPRRTMAAPQPRQPNRRMQPFTAVNPRTGERLIQDPQTGQWVPLPGTSRPNALPAPQ